MTQKEYYLAKKSRRYPGLVWYGTFEILYRIRQKINYHKYRRVPQKNENRKKVVPDAIFFVKTMFSYKKRRFVSHKVQKKAILDAKVMKY